MAAASSSAVFFLGSRAHYQVLQQPDTRSYDLENGNASTETIYQNPSVQELWPGEQNRNAAYHNDHHWGCYENGDVTLSDEKDRLSETSNSIIRRSKRRQSETTLCERDNEMRPALLNNISGSFTSKPKSSRRRLPLLAFLSSLARRKRRLDSEQIQYLQHLESAFNTCTYRESCRCLDCQSRYFDCDESEEYSSGESEYAPQYVAPEPFAPQYPEEDNDEVFVDTVPDDSTSADMLLEAPPPLAKMSVSSDEIDPEDDMQLEVAAGTPVLLNYLLTHPITCAIQ